MPERSSDRAWALIVQARGHVQGKVFRMSPARLQAILRDRGQGIHSQLLGRRLYGIPVELDRSLAYNEIFLEER